MTAVLAQAEVFGEQVTTNSLAQNIVYVSGTLGALQVIRQHTPDPTTLSTQRRRWQQAFI